MLICRPVSPRSAPEKIHRWIEEMEQKRSRCGHDPEARRFLDLCIEQAARWLRNERS